jgi:hypothetical protein
MNTRKDKFLAHYKISESILEPPNIEPPRIINFWQMPNTTIHKSIRIEKLPTEIIDSIIEASIFSEPLRSHDALYTL